ncbi:MAG: glutamate-1-semialdehyde 2,1-aminomutase [Nitrospiria bacterium]
MKRDVSQTLFETAKTRIPGGVNSPVRAFKSVGGNPLFMKRASGSTVTDVDGNTFIDYVLSWGPMILGHAHPKVIEAVQNTAALGTSFGAPSPLEVRLAELVQTFFPLMEQVRFVNSGTEATMSAIRLARGFTGRSKIIKFEGCYHGHADSLLVKAGSGATTLGVPDSPGVPPDLARDTITAPYNDLAAVQKILEAKGNQIACVIIEPVPGNMGTIIPKDGFLPGLRELTRPFGTLLIFDEVMSGFRAAPGGAQERYGIRPDLTCLGKVIGGGLPVGAFGGKKEIMDHLAPVGPVYQAGTLSGNPIAMAAGIATLELLQDPELYAQLEASGAALEEGLRDAAKRANATIQVNRVGSQMTLFFNPSPVADYQDALKSDTARFGAFFQALLENGVYFPPSQFEAVFLSSAHTPSDIEKTVKAVYRSFKTLQ